jgi:uncharacterized iron-regulated membrane protein
MLKNRNYYLRKTHRYLGVIIGIQFLLWTIGGLYFSWNNIDNVHGDHLRNAVSYLQPDFNSVSPAEIVKKIKSNRSIDSIQSINLISILNKPTYQINYFSGHTGEGMHLHTYHALADAQTGEIRTSLTKEEAIDIAKENIVGQAEIIQVDYLTKTNGHHEYREKPLPAWAITFKNPDCTIYISAELGTFQSIRHNQWRIFDFLYMLHTMDYQGRDDFNNTLLKVFSVFGVLTVCSGFVLFFISSPPIQKFIGKTKK